jgi:hypothetical protein
VADLIQHLEKRRYPELKKTCEFNKDRLLTWANEGYNSEPPRTLFVTDDKDEKGNWIIIDKPRAGSDDWNKMKRRTEDAPEQSPVNLLSEEYMSRIRGLWKEGTPLLHDILINPEHIRGESGAKLLQIDKKIDNVKEEYIRSVATNDKEKLEGIPPLGIPAGKVLMMVIGCTERAIKTDNLELDNDPDVIKALGTIQEYVDRAKQGDEWIKNMKQAFQHHIKKASELWANGANSLEKIHAHEEFWNADLLGWIRDEYLASAPRQEAGPEWRPTQDTSQPDPDRMSVSEGDAGAGTTTQEPEMSGPSGAEHPTTNAAAAEQSTAHTAQSRPSEESGYVSGSSVPTTDDYTVNYGGVSRTIGGYKYCGIKSGGVHGFSVLVSMKEDKFYHMIASSDVDADDSEPLGYLERGGYLVGDLKDDKKSLKKGTSIEGKKCHAEEQEFKNFTMSAYAVGARSLKSSATRAIIQYIKGSFNTGHYANKAFWYNKSSFCDFGGFRKPPVQQMIEKFRNEHGITLEDEVKLEDGNDDRSTHWSRGETTKPGGRDSDYFNAGFVVPDDKSGQASGKRSNPA